MEEEIAEGRVTAAYGEVGAGFFHFCFSISQSNSPSHTHCRYLRSSLSSCVCLRALSLAHTQPRSAWCCPHRPDNAYTRMITHSRARQRAMCLHARLSTNAQSLKPGGERRSTLRPRDIFRSALASKSKTCKTHMLICKTSTHRPVQCATVEQTYCFSSGP